MPRWSRRDPDAALRRFGRAERGFLDQVRLEALDDELCRDGPKAVVRNTWRMSGNRGVIELEDGTRLRLWLYWQGVGTLGSIARVSFADDVGWMVFARRPSGEGVRLVAFKIRVEVPTRDRERSRPQRP